MSKRDHQENKVGQKSIEAHYDRVPLNHPVQEEDAANVGAVSGSSRSGSGLGVSRGDYTDVPEEQPGEGPEVTHTVGKDTGGKETDR